MEKKQIKKIIRLLDPFYYVDKYVMPFLNPEKDKIKEMAIYVAFSFLFAYIIFFLISIILSTDVPVVVVVSYSMVPELTRGDVVIIKGVEAEKINAAEIFVNGDFNRKKLKDEFEFICYNEKERKEENCENSLKKIMFGFVKPEEVDTTKIVYAEKEIEIDKNGDIIVYEHPSKKILIIHRAVAKIVANNGTFILTKGDSKNNPFIDQFFDESNAPLENKHIKGKKLIKIPFVGYIKLLLVDDLLLLLFGCKQEVCYFP